MYIMRLLNAAAVFIGSLAAISLATLPARACDELFYSSYYASGPVYPAGVVYVPPCVENYAPRMYSPPPVADHPFPSAAPSYAPRRSPGRPTTTITIRAYDNYFEPKTIHVQPGTTVRWVNYGKHDHTATSSDERWDSGDIRPRATYSATFRNPGKYSYYCRHHTRDKMQGTIVVGESSASGNGRTRAPNY
jgi:plastocyanin